MKKMMLLAAMFLTAFPLASRAHCDTLDGPVVKTARAALDAGDVAPVLAWVKSPDEQRIRTAFHQAIAARKKGAAARDAADRRFFETLVRVHRAGEGAAYTGLKPAGADVGEAVRAADRAIEARDLSGVEQMLVAAVRSGLHHRFETLAARQPPGADVAAGRAWVEAYVDYVHFVERLEAMASGAGDHHGGEGGGHPGHAGAAGHAGHPAHAAR